MKIKLKVVKMTKFVKTMNNKNNINYEKLRDKEILNRK